MAEPSNPILGGLRGIRRTFSSNFFSGGRNTQNQNVNNDGSANIIQRNSLLLGGISNQLDSLNKQNVILNKNLEVISKAILSSSLLDKQREAANKKRESQAAEQGFRSAKEGAIESKIQNALVAPVKKISQKAAFSLGKLTQLFTILLGGWLIDNTFDLIKALAEGNEEKIKEIRNNIIKGLVIAGASFLLITLALNGLVLGLGKIGLSLLGLGGRGLLARPFGSLMKLMKLIAAGALGIVLGNPTGAGGTGGWRFGWSGEKNNQKLGNQRPINQRLSKPSGTTVGLLGFSEGMDVMTGVDKWWEAGIDFFTGLSLASLARPMTANIKHPVARGLAEALLYFGLLNVGTNIRPWLQNIIDESGIPIEPGETEADYLKRIDYQGDIMPGQFTPITNQDLLNEIEFNRPERSEFVEGEEGTKEFEKALAAFEAEKGDRIKELKARIASEKIGQNLEVINKDNSELINQTGSLDGKFQIITVPFSTSANNGDSNNTTVAAGAPGGGVPDLLPFNKNNRYTFLAYKHYQVVPK